MRVNISHRLSRHWFVSNVTVLIVVIIGIFMLSLRVIDAETLVVRNDDYCDDTIFGSDENSTSACSYYQYEPKFLCTLDGFNMFYLPNSRVQDGICDCCDGRDEIGSQFGSNCTNTCEDQLVILRKEALVNYRSIQSGIRAKGELLSQWRQRKNQDIKSFETLKQERNDMIEYLKTMRYLLRYKEEQREEEMRWVLLRERENSCASGDLESCNYFHPTYLNDQEMVSHGLPSQVSDFEEDGTTGGRNVNKEQDASRKQRKRFVYEYTKQELDSFKRSNGLQRVRSSICPIQDLLPDESSRIFVKLDEYYDFMLNHGLKQQRSTAARSERRMPLRKLRKHNTLFGRFLEDGEWGYTTFGITVSEIVGLALSPVSLSYRGVAYSLEMLGLYSWELIEKSDRELENLLPPEDREDNVEEDGLISIYLRKLLRLLKKVCEVILDAEVDNSPTARVLSLLDYTQYSFIVTRLDAFYENSKSLFWAMDIAFNAPLLYYEYYIQQKYRQLPPKRHACILREAIQQCETELDRLHQMMQEENEAQSLKAKSMEEALAFKRQTAVKRSSSKSAADPASTPVRLDFGIDHSWESLAQHCVSTTHFGPYNYTFCLFDEIKQDGHTSLGLFHHWGGSGNSKSNDLSQAMTGSGTLEDMPLLRQYLARLRYQAQRQAALASTSSSYVDMQGLVHSLTVELPVSMTEFMFRQWNVSESWLDIQKQSLSSSNIGVIQGVGQWLRNNIPSSVHLSEAERQALITEQLLHYYRHQYYDLGTACPVKPSLRRSTKVTFECGQEFRITHISEYSVCEYEMVVSLPLACDQAMESAALKRLDDLKVFGFSSKK